MGNKNKKDRDAIIPGGVRIPVFDGEAEAIVYPLGVRHLRKFNDSISAVMVHIVETVRFKESATNEEIGQAIAKSVAPFLMGDLFDLLADCVRMSPNTIKLGDLPHWDLPLIVETWVVESFGEEKKRNPWMRAIENLVARFTGKPFQISEILSKGSSQEGGDGEPSLTSASPESPSED